MIPRHQVVLFIVLLIASMVMGGVLWHLLDREHQRLLTVQDATPTHAPEVAPVQDATLMIANDADDSLQTRELSLPLPASPTGRARAVLGKLLDLYAAPDSTHPVPGGAHAIEDIFLLPAASISRAAPRAAVSHAASSGQELAIVNLSGDFAARHPSGIETETLTILSICATLHANLPQIGEVRFLVDGQPRATLAGHTDLTRTYLAGDAANTEIVQGAQP